MLEDKAEMAKIQWELIEMA